MIAMTRPAAITRGRKFDQVRDGASTIFLRDGYTAASVDDIARSARVSKATLYSYFPDKSLMFREVLRASLDQAFRQPPFDPAQAGTPTEALPRVLGDLARWLLSEPRLRLHRVITAEAGRFPEDANAYDLAMSDRVAAPLADLIDRWIAQGHLVPHASDRAATQLVAMLAGQLQQSALLRGRDPDPAQIEETVAEAASLYLAAHAPR